MSYHETYEFFALDRCLTAPQMRALRRISTRATITPNRFYNWYDWGGLKGSPSDMLGRYFDLFVHTGNGVPDWGMLRFPSRAIALSNWRPYVAVLRSKARSSRAASVAVHGKMVVLEMSPAENSSLPAFEGDESDDSADKWRDDEFPEPAAWPVPLALMRSRLLSGDLAPLYLLWLLSVQCGDRPFAAAEPPRPAALTMQDGALHLFAEFLGLNPDLMRAAFENSPGAPRSAGQLLEQARSRRLDGRRRTARKSGRGARRADQ
ncbi:MAG: hypothetical protein C0497_03535 [Gemmatimonas sp.]|nr:hypothetical protein [Gemmatimonas sp.]